MAKRAAVLRSRAFVPNSLHRLHTTPQPWVAAFARDGDGLFLVDQFQSAQACANVPGSASVMPWLSFRGLPKSSVGTSCCVNAVK